ncbi:MULTISPECIES: beta-carotene 15,15'-monooxygenase [Amniculibacterium]|uniref:beta-carotene 15,15'-monooxygenase n=1 Tax=Amniculibacterium TaxID=2715289 RepID=UPI000F5A3D37|nr:MULTISPECIES: beta-carotene 15,15'-monooxygenase [Amniculibacterium]
MADFDIDNFKKDWQAQDKKRLYNSSEILEILNHKSKNYVKYIFWISLAEFILFSGITLYYAIWGEGGESLLNITKKIGLNDTNIMKANIAHLDFGMKILNLLITGYFVILFYKNYKKISVQSNIKQFIIQILEFKKTVRYFILTNIVILVIFNLLISIIIFNNIQSQDLHLQSYNWWMLILSIVFTTLFSILLIYIYYKVLYGIILKKLSKNLDQLKEIDQQNEEK